MQTVIRILLLGVMVVLGFMVAFPQWADFLLAERNKKMEQQRTEEMSKLPTAPDDWHFKLEGSISADTNYKVTVEYLAKNETRACQYYSVFNNSYGQDVEFKEYTPKIDNGQHSITIPLAAFNPQKGCQFEVQYVYLEVFPAQDKQGRADKLFVNDRVKYPVSGNTLDIECAAYHGRRGNKGSQGCYQNAANDEPKSIAQRLYPENELWVVNINRLDTAEYSAKVDLQHQKMVVQQELEQLCRLLRQFDYVNNPDPSVLSVTVTDEVGNQVLQGNFGEALNKSQSPSAGVLKNDLKYTYRRLKDDISMNSNNQFIDPWQQPYVYQRSADGKGYRLMSTGPDSISSEDDLYFKCEG